MDTITITTTTTTPQEDAVAKTRVLDTLARTLPKQRSFEKQSMLRYACASIFCVIVLNTFV
jgi:hypothetical protein